MTENSSAARKPLLRMALIFFCVHSFASVLTFLYCYANCGVAQIEFVWYVYQFIDWPAVPLAQAHFGSTALMRYVFERGYEIACSGPNLRAFIIVTVAGGLQWFGIGFLLRFLVSRVRSKLALASVLIAIPIATIALGVATQVWWETIQFEKLSNDSLMIAARTGDSNSIEKLLAEGKDIETKGYEGMTALMEAAYDGKDEAIRTLLAHGANVNARRKYGITALHSAVYRHNTAAAKILLDHGANVNVQDDRGGTPLMDAAREGDTQTLLILLERGAAVNARDYDGETALMQASFRAGYVKGDFVETIRTLLHHGADATAKDNHGSTALSKLRGFKDPDPRIIAILEAAARSHEIKR